MRGPLGLIGAVSIAMALLAPWHSSSAGDADVAKERESLERHAKEPFEQRAREAALRALGKLGGQEAAMAVATVMDDPFVHLRDHAVSAFLAMCSGAKAAESIGWLCDTALVDPKSASLRRGAAITLGMAGGPVGVKALERVVRTERDPIVLVAVIEGLERSDDPAVPAALAPLLASKDGNVVGATARALGRARTRADAHADLIEPVLASGLALARTGAIDGLARCAPERLATRFDSVLADRAIEPRIAGCDALGVISTAAQGTRALGLLEKFLADASWRVRAAAYEAAISIWMKEAIPLLIARCRSETGRLRGDALHALRTLTGEDTGTDADVWDAWWKTRGPTFDLGPRPAPDAFGRLRRPVPAAVPSPSDTKTAAFFHLPILSRRLVFLFDFSGSMRDPVEGTGTGSGTKADLARVEFGRAAAALTKEQFFDLVIYRYPSVFPPVPRLTRALGTLSPGGDASAKKALAWLSKEEPKGWGAFYDALTAITVEDVDTIILLSDGVPSRGTFDREFRLLPEFVKANRFRRVVVDTVLVGKKGSDRKFMADLADATGGRFEDATENPAGK